MKTPKNTNTEKPKIQEHNILPTKNYTSEEIRTMRENNNFTLEIFAYLLGVSINSLKAWESGESAPRNSNLRLLYLLEKNPNLFIEYGIIKPDK